MLLRLSPLNHDHLGNTPYGLTPFTLIINIVRHLTIGGPTRLLKRRLRSS